MRWQGEKIGAFVSSGVGRTISALGMEWLVHVANVVDQKSESVRLGFVRQARVQSVLNVVVNITMEIIITIVDSAEPLNDIHHAIS